MQTILTMPKCKRNGGEGTQTSAGRGRGGKEGGEEEGDMGLARLDDGQEGWQEATRGRGNQKQGPQVLVLIGHPCTGTWSSRTCAVAQRRRSQHREGPKIGKKREKKRGKGRGEKKKAQGNL